MLPAASLNDDDSKTITTNKIV